MEVGGNGVNMTVPTLLEKGTDAQKELFIRKTLEGDYIWGQGYSEPGAGSDLASVRTRGELSADGSKWIINGQKIWTSQGMQATHMFIDRKRVVLGKSVSVRVVMCGGRIINKKKKK